MSAFQDDFVPTPLPALEDTLSGRPYVEGRDDCYGTLREFYRLAYGIHLRNYARPGDFAYSGLDLIGRFFADEDFVVVEVPTTRLQIGDVLLIRTHQGCPTVNHVAVAVGNNRMLHHLHEKDSRVDVLDVPWRRRVMTVVRRPDVAELNTGIMAPSTLEDSLPARVIHGYQEQIAGVLEPDN